MDRRLLGACLILAGLLGCAPSSAPPPVPRNLILVTIDTLRADRLGCYGSSDVETPVLDRLAAAGALFEDATVHVPLTRPSHVSLFTGRYPFEHGVRDNVSVPLREDVPTLAGVLKDSGFTTAAFVSSIVLAAQSGIDRGFDTYSDRFETSSGEAPFLNAIQKRGDETTREAVEWLRSHHDGRVFLWLHLYDPHDPYDPPEPYATRYAGRPYDGEVAWSDELVGRLLAAVAELEMTPDTLLMVTSDHGESLGEHGENGHGYFVYETTLHVPWIARGPGIPAGIRIAVTARTIDLVPTVLDLLALTPPSEMSLSGRSLAAALRGGDEPSPQATYAETLVPLLHYGWSDLRALRQGAWKYIQAPHPELYELEGRREERTNLIESDKARAKELRESLEGLLEGDQGLGATDASSQVPPELLEKLGALGYVGAKPSSSRGGDGSGLADPKDKLAEFRAVNQLIREGLVHLQKGEYGASTESFRALLARGVESFEAHYYLGRALLGLHQYRDAAGHFEKAVAENPTHGPAYLDLAEARVEQNDLEGAIEALHQGQEVLPKSVSLYEREGELWLQAGRRPEAVAPFEKVASLAPRYALVRVRLGEIYRDLGNPERAIELLRDAVELDPEPASYWNSLGMVLGGNERLAEAEAAFRQAVERDKADPQYAYNLGLALLRQGRGSDAVPYFEKVLAIDPRFAPARQRLTELRGR